MNHIYISIDMRVRFASLYEVGPLLNDHNTTHPTKSSSSFYSQNESRSQPESSMQRHLFPIDVLQRTAETKGHNPHRTIQTSSFLSYFSKQTPLFRFGVTSDV